MKKIVSLAVVLTSLFVFGCENSRELDFRSIYDHETGLIFSLGDSLSSFEQTLGTGERIEGIPWFADIGETYTFIDETLEVVFINDAAVSITVYRTTTRFEFKYMSFDMIINEMRWRFYTNHHNGNVVATHQVVLNPQGEMISNNNLSEIIRNSDLSEIAYFLIVTYDSNGTSVIEFEDGGTASVFNDVDIFSQGIESLRIQTLDW